jgi:hypothetical protein
MVLRGNGSGLSSRIGTTNVVEAEVMDGRVDPVGMIIDGPRWKISSCDVMVVVGVEYA